MSNVESEGNLDPVAPAGASSCSPEHATLGSKDRCENRITETREIHEERTLSQQTLESSFEIAGLCKLGPRLDLLQKLLEGLSEMPLQLNAILESLGSVHVRLNEVHKSVVDDDDSEDKNLSPKNSQGPLSLAAMFSAAQSSPTSPASPSRKMRSQTVGDANVTYQHQRHAAPRTTTDSQQSPRSSLKTLSSLHKPSSVAAACRRDAPASSLTNLQSNLSLALAVQQQRRPSKVSVASSSCNIDIASQGAVSPKCGSVAASRRPSFSAGTAPAGRRPSNFSISALSNLRTVRDDVQEEELSDCSPRRKFTSDGQATDPPGSIPPLGFFPSSGSDDSNASDNPVRQPSADSIARVRFSDKDAECRSGSPSNGDRTSLSLAPAGCLSSFEAGARISTVWEPGDINGRPQRLVLHPNSILRRAWDGIMIVSIFLVGVLIPIKIAYVDLGIEGAILLQTVDMLWIVDILINLRTAFIEAGLLVQDTRLIFWRYVRSWLIIDIVAAWPLFLAPTKSTWSTVISLLKLLRVAKLQQMLSKLQTESHHVLLLPLRIALSLFLSAHVMSCIWQSVQRDDGVIPGSELSPWDVYVRDMYWVFMTLTTVGYGDVFPEGTKSRLYAIMIMLFSPFVSGTIVSAISHAMRNLFDDKVEVQVADAARFMKRRGIGQDLQRRVEHNLRHHLRQKNRMDPEIFGTLSPAVQRELSLALLGGTVLQFPLFRGAQHSFVAELAQVHTWVQCTPGDLVAEEGQLKLELVFVVQGRLVMRKLAEDDHEEEVEIETGAWFGEACLFEKDCVHTSTVLAIDDCELAVLPGREYHRIMQSFPRLVLRHNRLEKALRDEKVSIDELAYRPPVLEITEENHRFRWAGLTKLSKTRKISVSDTSGWESLVT